MGGRGRREAALREGIRKRIGANKIGKVVT
jgi:hypothetical protein